jgi:endonuclease-8
MPEGDTIFRAARTLRRAMAGRVVTRFDSVFPHLTRVHDDTPITGRTIEEVTSAGKHLMFVFSGALVLRSHQRMKGSWHVYRAGEPWQRSAARARVIVGTADFVAVGFDLMDVAFHPLRTLGRDSPVGALGPDLLHETFDDGEARRRLRLPPDAPVAVALLDQWRLAGIGNVYKSETLFLCGIDPLLPISRLTDDDLRRLIQRARALMQANVTATSGDRIVTYSGLRRTTGRSNPSERLWVYKRAGAPCRRCGTPIRVAKLGTAARSTYWCPRCQT